jgi:hypothetical protein
VTVLTHGHADSTPGHRVSNSTGRQTANRSRIPLATAPHTIERSSSQVGLNRAHPSMYNRSGTATPHVYGGISAGMKVGSAGRLSKVIEEPDQPFMYNGSARQY